ncbi:TetR/AcrR family transcriptional regulator [Nocardia puris]|uniref:TetR/AcrR family transcriptional regulator n=1 Tax=Nocardia puris TaxID=208602 RepID=UPI001894BA3E|nr:TetR/AcrR family transcriptional regulator [Nocardia puris]MBF6209721.1 TetR/AcrR family transcriptional regulator [Nocardia puris]MBF6366293.1 TetR/AcrR family transcriptional regulator [Nocardia puris]MBF6458368.1 TetR/AcrR family transcriptional regulator [Nocardia puris]
MPGERKRMTRAESQQRTREDVLDAAEDLFLTYGLHGTTVAKIAAAAGRTQGAIYANFDSKENLCAEVLMRCYLRTFAALLGKVAEVGDLSNQQLAPLITWWKDLIRDESLVTLAAEYALAAQKSPDQLAVSRGYIEMGRNMFGAMVSGAFPPGTSDAQRETALNGILATSAGVALGRTFGVLDDDQVGDLLIRAARMWIADISPAD